MAHTNSTQNYGLPQWVGTDKPTFLGDLNSAFADIDARMKINSDDATALDGEVNTLKTNMTTAQENIATLQTGATEQAKVNTQLRNLISTNADSIDTLNTNLESINTALDGKQATITGGASSITNSNLTVNRALISDSSGKVTNSSVTSTELERLSGVTENIQLQINRLKTWTKVLDTSLSDNDTTHSYTNGYNVSNSEELLIVVLNSYNQILNTMTFSHNMLSDDNICRITVLDVADGLSGLVLATLNPTACTLRKFNITGDINLRIYAK